MKFENYIKESERTIINKGKELNLIHSALGVTTEIGEIVDVVKKHIFYGKQIDLVNLKEEIGDLAWYLVIPFREYPSNINYKYTKSSIEIDYRFINEFKLWQLVLDLNSFNYEYTLYINNFINPIHSSFSDAFLKKIFNLLNSLCEYFNIDFEDALETNINKLKIRYPEKFTNELALNRNLELERKVLEG